MYKLRLVFSNIKERYATQGVAGQGYNNATAKRPPQGRQFYFPLVVYLDVLQHLGLTKPYAETDGSLLTPKGMATDASEIKGLRTAMWLCIYFVKHLLLLVAFWPVFLVQRPGYKGEENSMQ